MHKDPQDPGYLDTRNLISTRTTHTATVSPILEAQRLIYPR